MVVVRRVFACALVLLLTMLVTSPAVAACQTEESGAISVPSGIASPPPVVEGGANHGLNVWIVKVFVPSSGYTIKAAATKSSFCLPSEPCPVQAVLPDFNVGWYTASHVLTANHNAVGDEAGYVPSNAAYGVVYMSTGPDWTLFDGPLSDGETGAKFSFRSGCA